MNNEAYRGLSGAIASVSIFMFTGKHSWENFGALANYYALTDLNLNKFGRILIDSVLRAYRAEVIENFGDRQQLEFYGLKNWVAESSVGVGKAAIKAIYLMSYVLGPLHRNSAKQGAAGINDQLIRRESA